jgi:hypothetical protein
MDETVTLVCGGQKCCPTATFHADGSVTLVDDDGEAIKLSAEQLAMLVEEAARRSA